MYLWIRNTVIDANKQYAYGIWKIRPKYAKVNWEEKYVWILSFYDAMLSWNVKKLDQLWSANFMLLIRYTKIRKKAIGELILFT